MDEETRKSGLSREDAAAGKVAVKAEVRLHNQGHGSSKE